MELNLTIIPISFHVVTVDEEMTEAAVEEEGKSTISQ